jgi:hypothetical protein
MRSKLVVLGSLLALVVTAAHAQETSPRFKGTVVASFLPDGRNMKLEKPFGFIDPKGKHWDVPAGSITDGASIPQVLWTTHPPFTGKYRDAAVIHDYYCRVQKESWQSTHTVFYEAMRTNGVDDKVAKVMFAVVYNFGPRWIVGAAKRGVLTPPVSMEKQREFMGELQGWVARANPSADEIAKAVDKGAIPR